jgi:site-specific recombinase XerD
VTGRAVECPIDEMNRPRGHQQAKLRIPPTADQVTRLFTGWREELSTCRKFAPAARNYTACRLMADVGLRVNEAGKLDLPDVKCDLGRFGKLHVRHGKGARGSGPRERMVPLINDAGGTQLYLAGRDLLAIEEVLGHAWIATTMKCVHVPSTHVEDAWIAGQARAVTRLEGLRR